MTQVLRPRRCCQGVVRCGRVLEADRKEGSTKKGVVSRIRPKSGPGRLVCTDLAIRSLSGILRKAASVTKGQAVGGKGAPETPPHSPSSGSVSRQPASQGTVHTARWIPAAHTEM